MEATNMKKTTNDGRKQHDTTKSKSPSVNPVNGVTEVFDCMSTEEINTTSQIHSPIQFQGKRVTPKVNASKSCFICAKILGKTELIDCPICFIKGSNNFNR